MTILEVYEKLDLSNKDCLIRRSDNWQDKVNFPSRVVRLLENNEALKSFDALFCFDDKPLIIFYENPKDLKELHKAIWNFNECAIVIVVDKAQVSVYNGFKLLKKEKVLERLGGETSLDDFTYFKLVSGHAWQAYETKLRKEDRVDRLLLSNIELVLKELCDKYSLKQEVANAIVGKIIFIRYLIDRKVRLLFRGTHKCLTNDDLCDILNDKVEFCNFISYLQDKDIGFDGEVFPLDKERIQSFSDEMFQLLIGMLKSDIKAKQPFLFDMFDFSVLPIEFISNVYEKFIGKENQAKNGAYYTPTFLVDYIVNETVSEFLDKREDWNCRILDPACGSGIFLVESLRKMIEKYIHVSKIQRTNKQFKEELVKIVINNIFGVDKDKSAVHVAIFSIYLTLLDYQSPADIEKFKFPRIYGRNLICANAFDCENEAITNLEHKSKIVPFDCIIGNPPWKRGGGVGYEVTERYISKKIGDNNVVTNKEISQAFVIRSLDFASKDTVCALIVTSKNLYNRKARAFRKYFLNHALIEQVFEMAPVRREIFNVSNDSAIAPACILFFRDSNGCETNTHRITHIALKPSRFFSIFKIFALSRRDVQMVEQGSLLENDWLWKVLVYGSYLDFVFIKRLQAFKTIGTVIHNERNGLNVGQGIKSSDGARRINVKHLVGLAYLKTDNVCRYSAKVTDQWKVGCVGYVPQNDSWYRAPYLSVREGTPNDLRAVAAINYDDAIYKSSLTSIRASDESGLQILKNIEGLLNSSLFAYYNLLTFSSSGIEREQTHDEEKWSVPYCSNKLVKAVERLEDLVQKKSSVVLEDSNLESAIKAQYLKIDNIIAKACNCSVRDLSLIDYAVNVSIPIAMRTKEFGALMRCVPCDDAMLQEYVKVFYDRFAPTFERMGKHFIVEGLYSDKILGFRFKVVSKQASSAWFRWVLEDRKQISLMSFLIKVTSNRITRRLFIQKDVRGFDRNGFYLFKPNERRLWHRAIAYLDAEEFADAILREGATHGQ